MRRSEIRGCGLCGPMGPVEYRALKPNQPLVLQREPDNAYDKNAVLVCTDLMQPCGYLAKEDAAIIAPQIKAGQMWFAKVEMGPAAGRYAKIVLWPERARGRGRGAS